MLTAEVSCSYEYVRTIVRQVPNPTHIVDCYVFLFLNTVFKLIKCFSLMVPIYRQEKNYVDMQNTFDICFPSHALKHHTPLQNN